MSSVAAPQLVQDFTTPQTPAPSLRTELVTRIESFVRQEYAHLLPEGGQILVEQIGFAATWALVAALGGSTFPVPHGKNKEGQKRFEVLVAICGEEAARKLVREYGGTRLYFPNCKDTLRRVRNICMIREFEERRARGESANTIIASMAPRYRLADRNIWDIVNKTTVEEWEAPTTANVAQLSLM